MLQDSLRCYRETGCGVGWGFRPRRGVRWGFRPGHGVCGDSGLGAGWGFGPRRGVCGDSGPGAGWGFRPRRGLCGDSGPERGVGIIWGKMGNFLPFCRFFAVWVEICISSRLCMILYFQKLIVLYSND